MREHVADEQSLWTTDELVRSLDDLRLQLNQVGVGNYELDDEQRRQAVEEVFESFIAEQLSHPERYRHILFTERGSVYFVLKNDQCMRIKVDSGPREYQFAGKYLLQPISERVFFLNTDYARSLLEVTEEKYSEDPISDLAGNPIETTDLSVGVTPLEVSIPDYPVDFTFDEERGLLTMSADEFGKLQGVHFGSPITRIVK